MTPQRPLTRSEGTAPVRSTRATDVLIGANRLIYRIARNWLLAVNLILAPWAILPFLAPLLESSGHHRLASIIYAIFVPFCHQREDRSFHLAGERMACCHRCSAMYVGMFGIGLLWFALRGRVRAAPWLVLVLTSLPLLLDGSTQLVGLRDSDWQLRVFTGLLMATGLGWVFLPRLERECLVIRHRIEARFDRLVAQGRAAPLTRRP